jgi:hypothetical protein
MIKIIFKTDFYYTFLFIKFNTSKKNAPDKVIKGIIKVYFFLGFSKAACAAANLAIGTRKAEQLT